MNENFKVILENNKFFTDIIYDIVLEIKEESKTLEPDFILKQDFLNKLKKYSLLKFFTNVSFNLGNIGISGIKFSHIVLNDIEGNKWKFLYTQKEFKLKSVEKHYFLEGFTLIYNQSESVIKKDSKKLSSYNDRRDTEKFECTEKVISEEFIDLMKMKYDIDLSFLLNKNIDDFGISEKQKKEIITSFNLNKKKIESDNMTTYFDKIKKDNKWFVDTIIALIEQNTKEYGLEDLGSKNQNEMLKACLKTAFNTANNDFDFSTYSLEKDKREVNVNYSDKEKERFCKFFFKQEENNINFTGVIYFKRNFHFGIGYKEEKSFLYVKSNKHIKEKVIHHNFEHVSEKINFKDIHDTISLVYDFNLENFVKESLVTIGTDKDKDKTIKFKNKTIKNI